MTEKKEKVVTVIKSEPKHDIKQHERLTRELPTDSKAKNPFVPSNQDNAGKSDSKKK